MAIYISVAEDLKEATREARETMKDLAAERKRGEEMLARIPELVDNAIGDIVREKLAQMEPTMIEAMRKSEERVFAKFDQISEMIMGETKANRRKGEPSLHDLIGKMIGLPPGIPFELTVENTLRPIDDDDRR